MIFRKEDRDRVTNAAMFQGAAEESGRPLWKTTVYMAAMIGILVFVNWAPSGGSVGFWDVGLPVEVRRSPPLSACCCSTACLRWFSREELKDWVGATRDFAVQVLPLLFGGVLVAGFLLGRPGHDGAHPRELGRRPGRRQLALAPTSSPRSPAR